MKQEHSPTIGVGAIVVHPNGTVLLGYRRKRGEQPTWCLPGGHVEPGESFEAAAIREIAEEAGLVNLGTPHLFAIAQRLHQSSTAVTGAVLIRLGSEHAEPVVLEPDVFSLWRWFSPDALPSPLFPASAAVLAAWRRDSAPEGWRTYHVRPATGQHARRSQ